MSIIQLWETLRCTQAALSPPLFHSPGRWRRSEKWKTVENRRSAPGVRSHFALIHDKAVLLEWWKKEWKKDNSRKRGCASTSTDPQPWLAPNISPCSSLSCSRTRRLWAKGKQTLIKCQCYSTTQPVLPEYLVTLLLCYMNTLLPENFDVAANDNLVFLSVSKSQTDHLYEEGNVLVIHLLWRLVGRIFISISCFHKNHLVFWN